MLKKQFQYYLPISNSYFFSLTINQDSYKYIRIAEKHYKENS